MYKRLLSWITIGVALIFLLPAKLPLHAQGPWPPVALNLSPIITSNRLTFEIKVTNQAEWDLTDFTLKAGIPTDTQFVEGYGQFDGAAVSFNGQEVTFSLVKLPTGATLGYRYTVERTNGTSPIYLPQIWVSWKGKLPGQYLFNSGQEPISTPSVTELQTSTGSVADQTKQTKIVHIHGNAYEQGFERGQGLAEKIRQQVDIQLVEILPKAYNAVPQKWLEAIHTQIPQMSPDIIAELRGMADGSGVPFDDLEIINFAEYVTPPGNISNLIPSNTVLAANNGATEGSTMLIGWNQSPKNPDVAPVFIVRHFSNTRPPRIDLAQPASLEIMLSITGNGLFWTGYAVASKETVPANAADIMSLVGEAMSEAQTLDELQQGLVTQPRLKSINMTIAALPQNKVRMLELSYTQYAERQPDNSGLLVSSDHFASLALQELQPPTINRSSTRYETLLAQAQTFPGALTSDVIRTLIHAPEIWDGQGFSFVMDASRMQLAVWEPIAQQWQELSTENLFTEQTPDQ